MDPEELDQIALFVDAGALSIDLPEEKREALTWKGILLSLRLDGSAKAVSLLDKLLAGSNQPELKILAFRFLLELALEQNRSAVDTLFSQAVSAQNKKAIEFLRSNPLLLVDPSQTLLFCYLYETPTVYFGRYPDQSALSRLFFSLPGSIQEQILRIAPEKGLRNWAIIVQTLRDPSRLQSLLDAFPQFQPSEQTLCLDLLSENAGEDPRLRTIICQLFILHDCLPARDLALTFGYHPDDPIQVALFFFLAENWQHYEQIDFSQRLLSTAYELAGPPVRRRILALSRKAGQVEWQKNLTSQSQTRWLKELSDSEWKSSIETLAGSGRYDELWLLAQAAPPLWSARILLDLQRAHWFPETEEEKVGFERLVELAIACHKQPLQFFPISAWDSPAREITGFALDHTGDYLAAGNSQTAILRWDLRGPDASPMQTLFSQSAGTSELAYSPDGIYLVVSSGDHKIRLIDLSKGMILKTLEGHKGLVRSLVFHPEGRFLYTASFDGTVQTWRFPSGMRVDATQASKQELFGLAISFDGKYLVSVGTERLIQVYSLPQMELARSLAGHNDTITLVTASPASPYAVTYSRDRTLISWNIASGKELGSVEVTEPLTRLAFHTTGQYIFGGTIHGDILIWTFPCSELLVTLKNHPKPVIGLGLKQTGDQLISASNDGKFNLWDLSTFFSIRTPVELLLNKHDSITKSSRNEDTSANERVWLDFTGALLSWRKRFDIEIAEMHSVVHIGEFDIEI